MFSDVDVKNRINKDLAFIPYNEANVSPIGYDLEIGELIFSKVNGLAQKNSEGNYIIEPHDTIHILTKEIIWLSSRVSATLHSRTAMSYRGLSNISTTVDPNWIGQLLITMTNLTDSEIILKKDKPFCTLIIHKLISPTNTKKHYKNFIVNYLTKHISEQNENYLKTVQSFIKLNEYNEFKNKLSSSDISELEKLASTINKRETINHFYSFLYYVYLAVLIAILLVIISSIFCWDFFKPHLQNLEYDSTILGIQIPSIF